MIKEREANSWKSVSYAKSISGSKTYTKFPIVLRTTEQSIPTWNVKGNMQQSGTPTPTSPITPSECGERTENLFDFLSWANSIISINGNGSFTTTEDSISITSGTSTDAYTQPYGTSTSYRISVKPNTTYTCKIGGSGSYQLIIFENGSASSGYTHYYDVGTRKASFTTKSNTTFVSFRAANTGSLGSTATLSQVMFAEGEYTTKTMPAYEPYGYKIPISSGDVTTNVYLSEPLRKIGDYADTIAADGTVTRRIKKIVLTGEELLWNVQNSIFFISSFSDYYHEEGAVTYCSTHYSAIAQLPSIIESTFPNNALQFSSATNPRLRIRNNSYTTVDQWKAYLAAQYAAGTPVTVWYVLATPTTETTTTSTIPTTSGLNTIDVNTTLKPSEMSLTYDGYKLCKRQRYSRTENLFDDEIASGYYNDSGELVPDTTTSHSTTYIPVDGTTYTISGLWTSATAATNFAVYEWDNNKNWLRRSNRQVPASSTLTFSIGSDTAFITLQIMTEHGNIMLNTGSTAKPYQPYLDWK